MTINFINADIKTAPQGYTMVTAFSSDFNCNVGINKVMDQMFNIEKRKSNIKVFKGRKLAKLDNLYMLLVKDSSYDKPVFDNLIACLEEFKAKCKKNGITKVAMPAICTGKNGFAVDDVIQAIDEIFFDTNISVVMYVGDEVYRYVCSAYEG